MAIIWQNTFDGSDGVAVTAANSANYGDALDTVSGVARYSAAWTAVGAGSILLGSDDMATPGDVTVNSPSAMAVWSVRVYARFPTGGYSWLSAAAGGDHALYYLDNDVGDYLIGTHDVSAHAPSLIDTPFRFEAAVSGGVITYRVWWTDPTSTGTPDWENTDDASAWGDLTAIGLHGGGVSTPPSHMDEAAIAQGEWIGPAVPPQQETGAATGSLILRGQADGWASGFAPAIGRLVLHGEASGWAAQQGPVSGTLVLRGTADGLAGPTVATAPPVSDMWIGPLGLLHRMEERGDWERTPTLGVETHVSLHGQVTASRARWAPRTTALTWDRLTRADADMLHEIALLHARADSTVAVIDPDAANLLTPEQSRGRPLAGTALAATEDLYQLDGTGSIAVGLISGVRYACTQDTQVGDDLTWVHPYYGTRGWPVMPGWPVYLNAAITGEAAASAGRLWLTFRDWSGAVISSAAGLAGTGTCEADAPAGAVTVTPHLVFTSALSGLHLIGEASLSFAPPDLDARPLGNGCPVYTVTGLSDTPQLPWRTTALQLQEVRALAVR